MNLNFELDYTLFVINSPFWIFHKNTRSVYIDFSSELSLKI